MLFFFFKQKTAYEMRISDWSSDVCSSDLGFDSRYPLHSSSDRHAICSARTWAGAIAHAGAGGAAESSLKAFRVCSNISGFRSRTMNTILELRSSFGQASRRTGGWKTCCTPWITIGSSAPRSEEHTSELPSLMSTSSTVFLLQK